MPNSLQDALIFLIRTLFDLYLFVLVIRLILAYVKASYFDPLTQFIAKLTDFIIKPTRRLIPNFGGIEWATLAWLFCLELIKYFIIQMLSFGYTPIGGLVLLVIGDIIGLIIQTFFYAILIQVVMSWVQPHSPITRTLQQFTSPIMRPFQRIIPLIGGIDISPIAALICLQLLNILIVNPIMTMGMGTIVGSY